MIRISRCLIPVAFAALLAACGGTKDSAQATAGGEILPGSASDAMLPLDTVRSQPPLAPRSEGVPGAKATAKSGEGDADGNAEASAEPAAAAPEPAAPLATEE